jgi:hypothetical protein
MKIQHYVELLDNARNTTTLGNLRQQVAKIPAVFSEDASVTVGQKSLGIAEEVDDTELERRMKPAVEIKGEKPVVHQRESGDYVKAPAYDRDLEFAIMESVCSWDESTYMKISNDLKAKGLDITRLSSTLDNLVANGYVVRNLGEEMGGLTAPATYSRGFKQHRYVTDWLDTNILEQLRSESAEGKWLNWRGISQLLEKLDKPANFSGNDINASCYRLVSRYLLEVEHSHDDTMFRARRTVTPNDREKLVDRHVRDFIAIAVGYPTFGQIKNALLNWNEREFFETEIYNSVTRLMKDGSIRIVGRDDEHRNHYALNDGAPEILIGATDDADPAPVSAESLAASAITTEKIKGGTIGSIPRGIPNNAIEKIAAQLEIHEIRIGYMSASCTCEKWKLEKVHSSSNEKRKAHKLHVARMIKDAL